MFTKQEVKLLYPTAYHLQIDGSIEKSNQIFEIAFLFQISHDTSYKQVNWLEILPKI